MRILVLAWDIPATTNMPGSPRLFSLSRELCQNHELFLASQCSSAERYQTFLNDSTARGVYKEITVLPKPDSPSWWSKQVHRINNGTFFETQYLYPHYHRQICNKIQYLIEKDAVNAVYVDTLVMAQYVGSTCGLPAIVDLHDCATLLFTRMSKAEKQLKRKVSLYFEAKSVARCEKALGQSFDLVVTNSPVDEAVIKGLCPSARTLTIANGVDSAFFTPNGGHAEGQKLLFTGVMNYTPNEDGAVYFSEQIFPLIRMSMPNAEFWIVGKDPTPRVQSLSQRPGVHVTGGVADMRPYFERASIFVCPLRYGSGVKNKLLAALAMRKPVVATGISIDGLDLKESRDLLLADDPREFAGKVVDLMQSPSYAETLAENGQRAVRQRYSWQASGSVLRDAFENLVRRRQPAVLL